MSLEQFFGEFSYLRYYTIFEPYDLGNACSCGDKYTAGKRKLNKDRATQETKAKIRGILKSFTQT